VITSRPMARTGVAVVGGGKWGVALAAAAARVGGSVELISRRDVEVTPRGVRVTQDVSSVAKAKLVILAVPSSSATTVVAALAPHLDAEHIVIHASRGMVSDSLQTLSEIVVSATATKLVGALGGPVLAADLLAGSPSVVVCGASSDEVGYTFVKQFMTPELRVYTTSDVRGVEWATALVGCLATIVGYAQGVSLSFGLVAALITRGVQEAARIVAAAGGDGKTLLGLAGYGELFAAVSQRDRPEILLGAALARGVPLDEAVSAMKSSVEAVTLAPRLAQWIKSKRVRAPIFVSLADDVLGGLPPETIVAKLMTLPVEDPG
jgi:glycerol-3-phosphate dehydrogenase (NAD(P)+)